MPSGTRCELSMAGVADGIGTSIGPDIAVVVAVVAVAIAGGGALSGSSGATATVAGCATSGPMVCATTGSGVPPCQKGFLRFANGPLFAHADSVVVTARTAASFRPVL